MQFVQQYPEQTSICRVYNKKQLVTLCKAYKVQVKTKWNKKQLAEQFTSAMKAHTDTGIPNLSVFDDRQFVVSDISNDETQQSVRITLRRV